MENIKYTNKRHSDIAKANGFGRWMNGKKHSIESRKKMSLAGKGRKMSEETRKKISTSKKGKVPYIITSEIKEKISKSLMGRECSKKTREKLSLSKMGNTPWNKGIKMSESFKKNLSILRIGEKNPNWCGGIADFPYPVDWTKTLRRSIRERDKYICQICKNPQDDKEALSVHHIDYNKNNCNPANLISLCHNCHIATNSHRDKWIEYFNNSKIWD